MDRDNLRKARTQARQAAVGGPYTVSRRAIADVHEALVKARKVAERHMTHRLRHGELWHEQTVTDLLCEGADPFITYYQFNTKAEGVVGADWLWWWTYATGECFGLLCQAKTLRPKWNGWKIDFRYPNGTGEQMRKLFATADLFEVPAAYMLYCGDIEYRGDLRCVPRHDPQPCGRCERASVSIVAGLLAENVSVGVRPAEAATDAFHLSLPLEDLVDPVGGFGRVMDLNIRSIGDTELQGFLYRPQHGPRQIAKEFLASVSRVRHGQFSLATAEPVDVGAHMAVFPEVPADRGHFGSPYFQHILRAGWPGGISPPGSHRTERDSLPSFRSSHLIH